MQSHSEAKLFRFSRGMMECDENGLRVAGQALVARSLSDNWTVQDPSAAAAALTRIYGFPITLTSKLAGLATVARALRENALPKAQVAALLLKFADPLTGNPSRTERQVLADNLVFSAILKRNLASDAMPEANVESDRSDLLENEMLKNGFRPQSASGRTWTMDL